MIRCGCTTEYDRTDHRHWPDDSDCLFDDAVELIRGVFSDKLPFAEFPGRLAVLSAKAEAFLAKIEKSEKS